MRILLSFEFLISCFDYTSQIAYNSAFNLQVGVKGTGLGYLNND